MKTLFYKVAPAFGIIPVNILASITKQNIICPFYHTVSDTDIIHIKHLYKVRTSGEFERDTDFFLKNYEPVGLHDFLNKKNPKQMVFHLSFDDGLKEFHDIVAPILLKKGVPATCFLNPAFIDNKDLFYRYKLSILIEKLKTINFSPGLEKELKNWFQQKEIIYDQNLSYLYSLNYKNRHFLDELAVLIEINFKDYLKDHKPYMGSEHIKSLINQGFAFGAHSLDHPQYSYLNLSEQLIQTEKSIHEVVTGFNLDYRVFSFPFTDFDVSKSFFDKIFEKETRIADFTFGCAGIKKDSCSKNIQRIPIEINNYSAKQVIYGEYLYFALKSLLNKNIIKRT